MIAATSHEPHHEPYVVDPRDPRAPPEDVWACMSPEERRRVVESLPSEIEITETSPPPEGDEHFDAKRSARDALKTFFSKSGKRVYIGCELPVYYPGEAMFSPDVMAVVDAPLHKRDSWMVSAEGRGLDFVLEVLWSGRRRKDLDDNVERYARLGIKEYFVFDRKRMRLLGYRLPESPRRPPAYQPILAQSGMYTSQVLGLEMFLEKDKLRFFAGTASLPDLEELVGRFESALDTVEARVRAAEERVEEEAKRAEDEAKRAEDEAKRAEEQAKRADEAERRLAEALAEIERLKKGGS
jgi:Uma2 family endonuclease